MEKRLYSENFGSSRNLENDKMTKEIVKEIKNGTSELKNKFAIHFTVTNQYTEGICGCNRASYIFVGENGLGFDTEKIAKKESKWIEKKANQFSKENRKREANYRKNIPHYTSSYGVVGNNWIEDFKIDTLENLLKYSITAQILSEKN